MAQCTSLSCPRLKNTDPDNRAMSISFPSNLATRDCLGNEWCNYCTKQPALIAWAKKHNWPELHATGEEGRYAIASGCWQWRTSIVALNRDAIDAFYAEAIGNEDELAS